MADDSNRDEGVYEEEEEIDESVRNASINKLLYRLSGY